MEKSSTHNCSLLPHSCTAGITAPGSIASSDLRLTEPSAGITNKPAKKLWSVYEGVYWI